MGEKPGGRSDDGDCTAEDFAKFFLDKVDSVSSATSTTLPQEISRTASHVIDEWRPVTALEVEKLISSSLNKTCQLDPAPTWLIIELCAVTLYRHPLQQINPWPPVAFHESTDTPLFFRYSKRTIWTPVNRRICDQFPTYHTFQSYLKESYKHNCRRSSSNTT